MDNRGIWISAPPRGRAHDFFAGLSRQQLRRWCRRGDGPIVIRRREEDRRCGSACVDRSFDSSELVLACPVLHERVEIGVALRFDDRVAQRLVGGLAAFQLGDTELGRHPVIVQIFALIQPVSRV